MKKIKNIAVISSAAVIAFATCLFAACQNNTPTEVKLLENTDRLVVIEASKTGGSLEDALRQLKSEGELDYKGTTGEFGFYLTSVNGYIPDASANEYWAIYTNLGDYDGVSYSNAEFGTYEYQGTNCAGAAYGVSGLPLIEGKLYIITIAEY